MADINVILDSFTTEKSLDGTIVKLQKIHDLTDEFKKKASEASSSVDELGKSQGTFNTQREKAIRLTAQEKVDLQIRNAEAKKQAKLTSELTGAYEKQSIKLNILRTSYKNLAVQGKENTREARNLKREIDGLDKSLKKVDASVGQHQRNVGNYADALSG